MGPSSGVSTGTGTVTLLPSKWPGGPVPKPIVDDRLRPVILGGFAAACRVVKAPSGVVGDCRACFSLPSDRTASTMRAWPVLGRSSLRPISLAPRSRYGIACQAAAMKDRMQPGGPASRAAVFQGGKPFARCEVGCWGHHGHLRIPPRRDEAPDSPGVDTMLGAKRCAVVAGRRPRRLGGTRFADTDTYAVGPTWDSYTVDDEHCINLAALPRHPHVSGRRREKRWSARRPPQRKEQQAPRAMPPIVTAVDGATEAQRLHGIRRKSCT